MENTCANAKNTDTFVEPSTDTVLCIVGDNMFNNEILSHFLESRTGLKCYCSQLSKLLAFSGTVADKKVIIFMDCTSIGKEKACNTFPTNKILQDKRFIVVCYNVDPKANLEKISLKKKIQGLIYVHQSIEMFPRTVEAVLNGELWYPRKVLEECFLSSNPQLSNPKDNTTILTQREKDILTMLGAGKKNQDIAKKLHISPHTVKTHAYNIYKKIGVTNRFQAAQWFMKNG